MTARSYTDMGCLQQCSYVHIKVARGGELWKLLIRQNMYHIGHYHYRIHFKNINLKDNGIIYCRY